MSSKIPNKGDIVINPQTSRPVKVGGRIWTRLVKQGLLEDEYTDENELCDIKEEDDVDEKIVEQNKKLPISEQAVRGRGRYKDKIVKRKRQASAEQVLKATAKKTGKKLKNRKVYEELHESGDFEKQLEELIFRELSLPKEPKKVRKKAYEKVESEEEESEDEESEDEESETETDESYDDY